MISIISINELLMIDSSKPREGEKLVRMEWSSSKNYWLDRGQSGGKSVTAYTLMEHIPAHKYIGIWDITVDNYCDFWKKHDCDSVCGFIDSMSHVYHPIVTGHTAGWFYENGKKGYFYGFGVDADYRGEIPKGFTIKTIPASDYMVFFHPPFDYLKDCGEVMSRVENLAWNFDPKSKGYTWNHEVCPDYQRHYPEVIGYEVLRAVRKIESWTGFCSRR